jgi:site-specific recombinase XerC
MAAMLVSSGTDIREIQEILGHASILSTQVYTKLPIKHRNRGAADMASAKLPIKK